MSTETGITIITPKSLTEAKELATTLAGARTIPEALQKSPADVLAIVMAGAELGLAPMQSVRALVLIKGKPTLSADAMGALVKSRRDVCSYLVLKHSDATRAVYETRRAGDPCPTTMPFTIEEARAAGLNGDNWRKFPAAMLRARALSAICRAVYPDLLLGVYDPDELAPEVAIEKATVVDAVATAAAPRTHRMVIHDVQTVPAAPPPSAPPVEQKPSPTPPPPSPQPTPAGESPLDSLRRAIGEATSAGALTHLVARLRALTEAERAELRPLYDAKLKELVK